MCLHLNIHVIIYIYTLPASHYYKENLYVVPYLKDYQ